MATAATAPRDLAAALGDRYQLVRLLGQGGMGAVHLARETALDRLVAIKTLPAESAIRAETRERFQREARTAARLAHPGIVPLYAYGEAGGAPYYVMGYVHGESLAARLAREGRIEAEAARELLAGVADALDYAHRQGVVHRDVKPDNLLLEDESGRPLLADFGVAKGGGGTLTAIGDVLGTPHYMAPEQAAGRDVDGRSDIYALGVVGFRMLSGKLPFEGATVQETLACRLTQDAPSLATVAPDVPANLAAVIDRCLARDPAARWPDGRSLREALAPGRVSEPDLPPALQDVESLGFWAAPAAVALLFFDRAARQLSEARQNPWAVTVITAMALLLPLPRLLRVLRARPGWRRLAEIALRPPAAWVFWYPARLRRPGDVWPRLPPRVRRFRSVATGFIALFALFPLAIAILVLLPQYAGQAVLDVLVGGALTSPVWVSALLVWLLVERERLRRWAVAEGLQGDDAHRLILTEPTSPRGFWKRRDVARRLSDPEPTVPSDPGACVSMIAAVARAASGELRDVAAEACSVARTLLSQVQAAEAELAQFRADNQEQLARIERDLAALGDGDLRPDQQRMRALLAEQAEILRGVEARRGAMRGRREALVAVLGRLARALRPTGASPPVTGAARGVLAEAAALMTPDVRGEVADLPTLPR